MKQMNHQVLLMSYSKMTIRHGITIKNKYSNSGSGNVEAIPVIAKVVGSTNVRAGNYKDTVTATVTY
ncbi:spore coat protein U domain-containing protein (plasmid) [Acinetobacter indicus]|nr:spore coat protein U domain-containing protein [Acinetobacter indicus]